MGITASPSSGAMTRAPGRSAPRTARRKNSRSGLTSASFARCPRRCPSGSWFDKERRHAARHSTLGRHETAGAAFEREAQSRALRIVAIVLLERKNLAVAGEAVDDANLLCVQAHGKSVGLFPIKHHRAALFVLSSSPLGSGRPSKRNGLTCFAFLPSSFQRM